jgi:hypothetical protein
LQEQYVETYFKFPVLLLKEIEVRQHLIFDIRRGSGVFLMIGCHVFMADETGAVLK